MDYTVLGGHPICLSVIILQKVILIKYSIIILYYIHNDDDNYFMTVLPWPSARCSWETRITRITPNNNCEKVIIIINNKRLAVDRLIHPKATEF